MTTSKEAAYVAGAHAALTELGMEKDAFAAALGAIGRSVAPHLARAGRNFLGGVSGQASLGKSLAAGMGRLDAAGKAGMGALQANAPGVAKGLQTAGKVLTHPATQVGMVAAPMVMGNR